MSGAEASSRLEPLIEPPSARVVLRAEGLAKIYPAVAADRRGEIVLFRGLNLSVVAGEMVAVVGESGAGKSTLLHLLAALDRPTDGEVWCGERRVDQLSPSGAAAFRNREVGYVWQFHYLMPEFSALENVAMPLMAQGMRKGQAGERARRWLEEVGLGDRMDHRAGQLSGGEQQRVSLARALVTEPRILLADEPTGDLDGRTAETIFGLIQRLHREHGLTTVIVTHHLEFAARCDRVLRLQEGQLKEAF